MATIQEQQTTVQRNLKSESNHLGKVLGGLFSRKLRSSSNPSSPPIFLFPMAVVSLLSPLELSLPLFSLLPATVVQLERFSPNYVPSGPKMMAWLGYSPLPHCIPLREKAAWVLVLVLEFNEEEAKKKIYFICTLTYIGFGVLILENLSYKVKGLLRVL
ncbi:multiple organellar RNA editing factor 3, mitochondrial-like [Dioscorea cayenensis subsp. rotundata]|uniref:Multiple organellar RNA editing factor 3, mitochondrial-like n=1 Tax=Dioscorea cayennensis subsp. rotundata TaxID=55577 RepID=A0AB40C682_DIOCR|nr:multiple organellar RNA editing factor 3, mitochondrial-like [Dioscorea cayenensis subsp. rotundata]